jgi:hypothetical protein
MAVILAVLIVAAVLALQGVGAYRVLIAEAVATRAER